MHTQKNERLLRFGGHFLGDNVFFGFGFTVLEYGLIAFRPKEVYGTGLDTLKLDVVFLKCIRLLSRR